MGRVGADAGMRHSRRGPHVIEEIVVECPSCGELFALDVDTTGGEEQSYFEDCPVCCKPMEVFVRCRPGEILSISVSAD
jgi:hypothetical protein